MSARIGIIVTLLLMAGHSARAQDAGVAQLLTEFWSVEGKACAVSDPSTGKTTMYAVLGPRQRSPIRMIEGYFQHGFVTSFGDFAAVDTEDCLLAPRRDGGAQIIRTFVGSTTRTIDLSGFVPDAAHLSPAERERQCGRILGAESGPILRVGFDFELPRTPPNKRSTWEKFDWSSFFRRIVRIDMRTGLVAQAPEEAVMQEFVPKEPCLVLWAPESRGTTQ